LRQSRASFFGGPEAVRLARNIYAHVDRMDEIGPRSHEYSAARAAAREKARLAALAEEEAARARSTSPQPYNGAMPASVQLVCDEP
jgi:hypothetical protein